VRGGCPTAFTTIIIAQIHPKPSDMPQIGWGPPRPNAKSSKSPPVRLSDMRPACLAGVDRSRALIPPCIRHAITTRSTMPRIQVPKCAQPAHPGPKWASTSPRVDGCLISCLMHGGYYARMGFECIDKLIPSPKHPTGGLFASAVLDGGVPTWAGLHQTDSLPEMPKSLLRYEIDSNHAWGESYWSPVAHRNAFDPPESSCPLPPFGGRLKKVASARLNTE
jgi:hypothetical protein